MSNLLKVGRTVYSGRSVVGTFVLGTWYELRVRADTRELVPCTPERCRQFNELVDAETCSIAEGELAILEEAEKILARCDLSPKDRSMVVDLITDALRGGLRKHGPFDASAETRALEAFAARKATNLLVYAAMYCVVHPSRAVKMQTVASEAVYLLLDLVHDFQSTNA